MIPILYGSYEIAFTSNGLGRLADCISCTVTEERNGIYECQFLYPVTGAMYDKIKEGCIIGVTHDEAKDIQPFDIYARSAPLNGVVTFYARHISYRLSNVILKPFTASSCSGAMSKLKTSTYNTNPFTFWTDKSVSADFSLTHPESVRATLAGQEGSILDVYGTGEYLFDKWAVKLYQNRGNDNGVAIRYGVNLTELTQEYDQGGTYTAVAPYWQSSEDGTVVTLSDGYVVSGNVPLVMEPWTTGTGEIMTTGDGDPIFFNYVKIMPVPMDLSEAFEEAPTEAQLRTEALRRLNNSEAWLPSENITVSFVNLADTEEYRSMSALQRVRLCDKVSVYCGPLGVSAVKMKVIRVVYNVLENRYDEIELGKAKTTFAETILTTVADSIDKATKDLVSVSVMEDAISSATSLITGATDSHIKFVYDANGGLQEILIMDTEDVNTAVKVWRWNSGGLGFSSNGYAGPYGLAMTQDGAIVADFITAGHMVFGILQGGVMTLGGNGNVNGEMQVLNANGTVIGTWDKDGITLNKGSIQGPSITVGGSNNASGTLTVKNASGDTIATLDRNGLDLNAGSIDLNNGTFKVTSGGALTASNANIGGSIQSTGTDIYDNTIHTRIANGKIRMYGDTDDGDYQSFQPHTYLYLRSLRGVSGSDPSADITSYTKELSITCTGLLDEHAGTLELKATDGDYYHASEASAVKIAASDIKLTTTKRNGYPEQDPLILVHGQRHWLDTGAEYVNVNVPLNVYGNLAVNGSLSVTGTKPRLVSTDQYSDRFLYCYETPSPMFGDVGEGVIGEDGLCYITLDAVFAQTISTTQYQVFLQKYGDGDCWVHERRGAYFIVKGTPGLAFGWEIKAKQADFDQLRLERNDERFSPPQQNYGIDAANHIDELRKERESA